MSIKRHYLLDLWLALGGSGAGFEDWMSNPQRTTADAWAQLLAVVRGDLMPGDTNPPPGAILLLVEQRLMES